MTPFLNGLILGLIIGTFCTGMAFVPAFRERVVSMVAGLVWGKKGRKSKSKSEPTKRTRVERTEKCIRCGEASPLSELEEVNLANSKGKAWIHPACHED